MGTVIEFDDFTVFATAAALVFNKVFFASRGRLGPRSLSPPSTSRSSCDRSAQSSSDTSATGSDASTPLVATLVLVGLATVGIGVLPTADAIVPAAAIFLVVLRCVQGLAMGGEDTDSWPWLRRVDAVSLHRDLC